MRISGLRQQASAGVVQAHNNRLMTQSIGICGRGTKLHAERDATSDVTSIISLDTTVDIVPRKPRDSSCPTSHAQEKALSLSLCGEAQTCITRSMLRLLSQCATDLRAIVM